MKKRNDEEFVRACLLELHFQPLILPPGLLVFGAVVKGFSIQSKEAEAPDVEPVIVLAIVPGLNRIKYLLEERAACDVMVALGRIVSNVSVSDRLDGVVECRP